MCPNCGKDAKKVIYFGFPMRLCPVCQTLYGFWSWVPCLWFNGAFMTYDGLYLKALWYWLRGGFNHEQ